MRIVTLRPDDGPTVRDMAFSGLNHPRFWLNCSVVALCYFAQINLSSAETGKKPNSRKTSDMIDLVGLPFQPLDLTKNAQRPRLDATLSERIAEKKLTITAIQAPKSARISIAQPAIRPVPVVDTVTPVAATALPSIPITLRMPSAPASIGPDFVASIAPAVAAPEKPAPLQPVPQTKVRTDMPSPPPRPTFTQSTPPVRMAPAVQHTAEVPPTSIDSPDTDTQPVNPRVFVAAAAPRSISEALEAPKSSHGAPRPLDEARNIDPITTGSIPSVAIDYVVRSQPLDQVLREIGQMAGLNVIAGAGVRSVLRERRLQGSAEKVIDQLAREHGLFWFNDGLTVYVDPVDDQKIRFFKVRGATPAQLSRAIDDAGLGKFRSRIQLSGKDGLVRVSGSDAFTRTVEAALTSTEVESNTIHVIRFGQRGQ